MHSAYAGAEPELGGTAWLCEFVGPELCGDALLGGAVFAPPGSPGVGGELKFGAVVVVRGAGRAEGVDPDAGGTAAVGILLPAPLPLPAAKAGLVHRVTTRTTFQPRL